MTFDIDEFLAQDLTRAHFEQLTKEQLFELIEFMEEDIALETDKKDIVIFLLRFMGVEDEEADAARRAEMHEFEVESAKRRKFDEEESERKRMLHDEEMARVAEVHAEEVRLHIEEMSKLDREMVELQKEGEEMEVEMDSVRWREGHEDKRAHEATRKNDFALTVPCRPEQVVEGCPLGTSEPSVEELQGPDIVELGDTLVTAVNDGSCAYLFEKNVCVKMAECLDSAELVGTAKCENAQGEVELHDTFLVDLFEHCCTEVTAEVKAIEVSTEPVSKDLTGPEKTVSDDCKQHGHNDVTPVATSDMGEGLFSVLTGGSCVEHDDQVQDVCWQLCSITGEIMTEVGCDEDAASSNTCEAASGSGMDMGSGESSVGRSNEVGQLFEVAPDLWNLLFLWRPKLIGRVFHGTCWALFIIGLVLQSLIWRLMYFAWPRLQVGIPHSRGRGHPEILWWAVAIT